MMVFMRGGPSNVFGSIGLSKFSWSKPRNIMAAILEGMFPGMAIYRAIQILLKAIP